MLYIFVHVNICLKNLSRLILQENEDSAHREWLKNLLGSLLGSRRRSFIDAISKCLSSRDSNMVQVCLITVAWLSSALSSLSDAEHQLLVFSALVPQLKEKLESGEQMEHKILASFSILNFCKIPGWFLPCKQLHCQLI